MMYLKKRIEYLNQILHKAQNFKNDALRDLYDHNEQAKLCIKDFRELTQHSLEGSKNFVMTRMPVAMQTRDQLYEFLGLTVFQCFDLEDVMTIFSQILMERQIIFLSERRDLVSKVMFSFRDLMLSPSDFRWPCFFVTCLPSILIDNLNAPFPNMLGIQKELFDANVQELVVLFLGAKDGPFAVPSPVIVDVDSGKVIQIEKYYALVQLEGLIATVNNTNDLTNNQDA